MREGLNAESLLPLNVRGLGYKVSTKSIIEEMTFDVSAKGIIAIMGPNGAGKSVLLRLLHGLLEPSAGTISWNGSGLGESVRKRQALVFQRPVLLRRTVLGNVEFVLHLGRGAKNTSALHLLNYVGLEHLMNEPARRLSGGEQQRLAMARALALDPEILFMDEPTASLDPASVEAIESLVREVRSAGTTVFFVTHDAGQARRLADDIIFVHGGRVAEHSSANVFFDRPQSQEAQAYLDGRLFI